MHLKKIIKMDESQALASKPDANIWVNANAGTGKTTILTSRVLRLLLHGISPKKILCLTYTKAAAAEMLNRINQTLADWAICSDTALTQELHTLLEIQPSAEHIKSARSLFIDVLETHEGLKVQTIHSFAQSILRRFPVEAGVSPYFTLMDEQEASFISETALSDMVSHASQGLNPILREAIESFLENQSEYLLKKTLSQSLGDVMKWKRFFYTVGSSVQAAQKLSEFLGINHLESLQEINDTFVHSHKSEAIDHVIVQLHNHEKSQSKDFQKIIRALALKHKGYLSTESQINEYLSAFLTEKSTPRKFIEKLKIEENVKDFLLNEAENCRRFACQRALWNAYHKTVNFYKIAEIYQNYYARMCDRLGFMDYQQLLIKTEELLSSQHRISGWVMYKLDGGLDHILVDEAQDTSPEQWQIIKSLSEEFFSGEGKPEDIRTLFIVGDEKQSIFSFQGADILEFERMRNWFADKVTYSKLSHEEVSLENSYRSAEKILDAVNATVRSLGFKSHHQLTKHNESYKGRVVLWPYVSSSSPKSGESSLNVIEVNEEDSLQKQLSEHIATHIADWLKRGKCKPEDIMILVRSRTTLVEALARSCQVRHIPVTSVDRKIISEHLAIRDLLSFGRWLTLPENDYDLACVLRSPIGQISEETLFKLAHNRKHENLWQRLKAEAVSDPELQALVDKLAKLLSEVDYISPYQIFHNIIFCNNTLQIFKARMGDDVETIFADFLKQVDAYERKFPASMQLVLDAMECNLTPISRLDGDQHSVRIMTVHGSKGLEANIVIMADAASTPKSRDSLVWLEENRLSFPLFPPDAEFCNERLSELLQQESVKREGEYQRLLYVAMTRAREELYITGFKNRNSNIQKSWYAMLINHLADIAEIKTSFDLEESLHPLNQNINVDKTHILTTNEPSAFLISNRNHAEQNQYFSPSITGNQDETYSTKDDTHWQSRMNGKVMHAALQLLRPPVVKILDQLTIEKIVGIAAQKYGVTAHSNIADHIWRLIKHPDIAFLFENALVLNETAISGPLEIGKEVKQFTGQIDKAVMLGNDIWVIDFKTSINVPHSIESTPPTYLRQISIYQALLKNLYPTHQVHAALVWTHAPMLQLISPEILRQVLLDEGIAYT